MPFQCLMSMCIFKNVSESELKKLNWILLDFLRTHTCLEYRRLKE